RITTVQFESVISHQCAQDALEALAWPRQSVAQPMDADETTPMAHLVVGRLKGSALVPTVNRREVLRKGFALRRRSRARRSTGDVEHRQMIVLEGADDRACF